MLRLSDHFRVVVLWAVGRLLMLDTRVDAWQRGRGYRVVIPGKTLRMVKGGEA